jgi:hypothetical protein
MVLEDLDGAAAFASVLLSTGARYRPQARSPSWLSGLHEPASPSQTSIRRRVMRLPPLDTVRNSDGQIDVPALDTTALGAACSQLGQGIAALKAEMPSPDPKLTDEMQNALIHFDLASLACNESRFSDFRARIESAGATPGERRCDSGYTVLSGVIKSCPPIRCCFAAGEVGLGTIRPTRCRASRYGWAGLHPAPGEASP